MSLRIAINGRFLSQTTTGVQRMAREFLRALDRLLVEGALPEVEVRLLAQRSAVLGDLALSAIRLETIDGVRSHAWEQFVLPRHVGDGWLLNLGNTAPVASLIAGRRVAVVIHDISYRLFPEAYTKRYQASHRMLNRVLMTHADPIVTVAEAERAMIARFYPAATNRITVAANGGWPDGSVPLPPAEAATKRYGLYVGSLSRRKNVQGVIATAIRLARSRGIGFRIVGAPSPILTRIALALPDDVRPLIEFCGQIEDGVALRALYRDAAFLLFPSFYEASALPPMEAMGQGCPVIASNIPAMVERCGDAAVYCDPADQESVVAAALQVLDDPAFAAALAEKGWARAARFTWRAQAMAIVEAMQARQG